MQFPEWQPIPYLGSFQCGPRIPSEDPRGEVWRWIARLGTVEETRRLCAKYRVPKDRPALVSARIRQGVELRRAARQASLLTAPLLLYYSFQNLVRAFVGITRNEEPRASHGLEFHPRDKRPLEAEAQFVASGTFPAFVQAFGGTIAPGKRISLAQALASIPELNASEAVIGASRVAKVRVTAYMDSMASGNLKISLPGVPTPQLRQQFGKLFPLLSTIVAPGGSDDVFTLTGELGNSTVSIGDKLVQWLLPDLRFREDAVWYCLRADDSVPELPRIAYYFVAVYLLSNLVRYEPRLVAELNPDSTELGWTLREFLNTADRYFPQLLISIGRPHPMHFG